MEAQQVAVVAVMPADNLAAALADYARLPPPDGGSAGPAPAVACRRALSMAARAALRQVWPHTQVLDDADWIPVAQALAGVGVAGAVQAAYRAAWEQGDAILVLTGLPAGYWPLVEQALAAHLRAEEGGGARPAGGATPTPPPFAVFAPPGAARPAAPPEGVHDPGLQPDRPVGPAISQRYADVRAPALVPPEQLFAITVALTRAAPDHVRSTPPLQVYAGPTPVSIILYAVAFEIVGSARADLEVHADRDSGPVVFQLRSRPGIRDEQQVSVTFLQGAAILGRVVVAVQVGGQAPTSTSIPTGGPPDPGPA